MTASRTRLATCAAATTRPLSAAARCEGPYSSIYSEYEQRDCAGCTHASQGAIQPQIYLCMQMLGCIALWACFIHFLSFLDPTSAQTPNY